MSSRNSIQWLVAFLVVNGMPANAQFSGMFALRADNGDYVAAEGGGGREVVANRRALGPWETFEVTPLGDNKVAVRVSNGRYVCAEGGGGRELVANRETIGPWETFEVVRLGNMRIALRASNGQYVSAEGGGGRELVADRDAIAEWETFEAVSLPAGVSPGEHLRYFGYWGGVQWGSLADKMGYITLFQDHSNVAFISSVGTGDKDSTLLREAVRDGMTAVIGAGGLFVNKKNLVLTDPSTWLEPPEQYMAEWTAEVNDINPYAEHITAFMVSDEPDCRASVDHVDWHFYYDSLNTEAAIIKASFPNIPITLDLCGAFMSIPGFKLPPQVDLIGIECYTEGVEDCSKKVRAIKAIQPAKTRYMIVSAGSSYGRENVPVEQVDQEIAKFAIKYFVLAAADPAIVGLEPFLWQTQRDPLPILYGVEDLPMTRAAYNAIGRKISGRPPAIDPPDTVATCTDPRWAPAGHAPPPLPPLTQAAMLDFVIPNQWNGGAITVAGIAWFASQGFFSAPVDAGAYNKWGSCILVPISSMRRSLGSGETSTQGLSDAKRLQEGL